ncbi:acetylcholine receptor subunit alpha-like 1 [Paramacrobiotus metropolitanus]|uniref:acetylcholine receptor subunit alpha-like 1 n=1 Tax=Paramacrobiotus metropolitanus TaxID=2943436 RepID=UPI002445DF88|nr:acetylcholine receptor subunit alpha-like 1 [Paramacrobiotus metropolitanus]
MTVVLSISSLAFCMAIIRSGYCIVDINGKSVDNNEAAVELTRSRITTEKRLRSYLFEHYDRKVRPSGNKTDTVSVYVSMMLLHIEGINEQRQVLRVHTWTSFRWNDVRLVWDSSEYANITTLHTADEELWLPDITLYNNAEGKDIHNFGSTTIMVQSNGDVVWVPPASFSAQCNMNFDTWPRDKHRCHLLLGSWTQHGFDLDIQLDDAEAGIDTRNFVQNDQWLLTNVSATRTQVFYPCCVEPYVSVSFTLQLRRNPSHYFHTLVLPVIILLIASWFLFIIPDYRFRLLVGLLEILALSGESIFLYSVAPPSTGTPPIVRLVAFSIGFVLYALVLCMILDAVRRCSKPLPKWIQATFNPKMGFILLLPSTSTAPEQFSENRGKDGDKEFLTVDFERENNPQQELTGNDIALQRSWKIFTDILSRICLLHYAIGSTILIIFLW